MMLFSGVININGSLFLMFSVFTVAFVGYLLGRITIKGVSLGNAGAFIIALLYGALFSDYIKSTITKNINDKNEDISSNCLKIVENIGLIFFIGAVGNISGPTFFVNIKKNFKSYILINCIIIIIACLTCVACFHIGKNHEKNIDEFVVMTVGIFSGALSSTPAFSAAKSSAPEKYQSAVTVGYAITYLFGVIGIVLFVQLVPKILGADMEKERAILLKGDKNDKSDDKNKNKNDKNLNNDNNISKHQNDACSENCVSEKNEGEKEIDIQQIKTQDELILSENVKIKEKGKEKEENKIKSEKSSEITKTRVEIKDDYEENEEKEEKGENEEREENEEEKKAEEKKKNKIEEKIEKEENGEKVEKENKDDNEKKEEKEENEEKKEKEEKNGLEKEEVIEEQLKNENKEPDFLLDSFGFCVFSFSAIIGIFIGEIKIPLSNKGLDGATFSFTTTGGLLFISLIMSYFGRFYQISLKIDKKILETIRELGLVLFLTGSGIAGGIQFLEYFKVVYFFYGIFITILPMIGGFLFSKYVLKLNLLNNLGTICGGMTSTPALGTLISVSGTDEVAGAYAATYPVALIFVVLAVQLISILI